MSSILVIRKRFYQIVVWYVLGILLLLLLILISGCKNDAIDESSNIPSIGGVTHNDTKPICSNGEWHDLEFGKTSHADLLTWLDESVLVDQQNVVHLDSIYGYEDIQSYIWDINSETSIEILVYSDTVSTVRFSGITLIQLSNLNGIYGNPDYISYTCLYRNTPDDLFLYSVYYLDQGIVLSGEAQKCPKTVEQSGVEYWRMSNRNLLTRAMCGAPGNFETVYKWFYNAYDDYDQLVATENLIPWNESYLYEVKYH